MRPTDLREGAKIGNLRQVIREIFSSTPFAAVLLSLGFALSVILCACGDDDYDGGPQKLTGPHTRMESQQMSTCVRMHRTRTRGFAQ